MGAYYWFQNGMRQQNKWENAWGMTYYVGADGRKVQGYKTIGGKSYYFGDNGTSSNHQLQLLQWRLQHMVRLRNQLITFTTYQVVAITTAQRMSCNGSGRKKMRVMLDIVRQNIN
ncbi:hypothetical protein [Weissella cibaria]|uniref:hypothetical protein n=1 Tax=Weissella cibaria TaxID=137591 RepID=UPI00215B2683|nr:hypothetical protein [Weissella cibaria]MCR8703269.1 hypothetical protein [Weissella cibaria]